LAGDGGVSDPASTIAVESYGSSRPVATRVADVEVGLAAIHPLVHELELRIADLGIPIAPLYLASARGSLRHVSACIEHDAGRYGATDSSDEIVRGSGVKLVADGNRPGIGNRVRRTPRRTVLEPLAEIAPWAATPDLGADLVASAEAISICAGPVGATLLFCALAHHWWMHRATGAKWSTDVSGAHALIAALNDGAGCAMPVTGTAARLVDAEVLALLDALGWSRLVSPPIPRVAGI
jgi:hypothetical protein